MVKDHPETITIKPETVNHAAELFSWVPLPYCSPAGCPFPIKSPALSAHVSPRTIHFRVLDKSPVLGPGRGPRSYNNFVILNMPGCLHPLPLRASSSLPLRPNEEASVKKGIRCSETSVSARETATLTSVYSSCSLLDWQPCFRQRRRKGKLNLGVCLV